MMFMDLHMHSNFSDGRNSIEEMVETAIAIGYHAIAITDHVWISSKWVPKYAEHINALKKVYRQQIRLFSGIEAKVVNLQGDIDAHPFFDAQIDLVLGSIHRIPHGSGYYHPADINSRNEQQVIEHWLQAFSGMLKNPRVDIVAHPLAELKEFGMDLSSETLDYVARLLADSGKIVEINVRHQAPEQHLIQLLQHEHLPFIVSSDSHSVEDLRKYSNSIRNFIQSNTIRLIDIEKYVERKRTSIT